MHFRTTLISRIVPFSLALMFALACQTIAAAQGGGFVYVATNQTTGNAVIQFARSSNGSLKKISQVSTGGLGGAGNGVGPLDPLGSQDSLVLSGTGSLLLVVNAGSNQVSSLRAGSAGLALLSTVASGGVFPSATPRMHRYRPGSTGTCSSGPINGSRIASINSHTTGTGSGTRATATSATRACTRWTSACGG